MKRFKHSRSHFNLLSCDMGELVPIGLQEVLPGDTVQQATSALLRVSPLLAPVMHPVHVRIHHWFVPLRLIWDDFEDFITGGPDGLDDTVAPYKTTPASTGYAKGSLSDYLGVPPGAASLQVSALSYRAYMLIYNEFYRDQDLQTELALSTASGEDTTTSVLLQHVCWEKDYFTTARPWAAKGPDVTIPVVTTGDQPFVTVSGSGLDRNLFAGASNHVDYTGAVPGGNPALVFGSQTGLGVTPEDLRTSMALIRMQEARAQYGSRYTEYLRYLGVRSSDARLQRPEYLGGGKQTVQFSEVLQTAEGTDPVGDMKGHGIAAMRSNRYRRFFEEHGLILTLMSVKPKTIYMQGLHKLWSRTTKEDYFQKELQHIGQQAILNKEIYAMAASPDAEFGFVNRYEEYRRGFSRVAGDFRDTLDYWHMARIWDTGEESAPPGLNGAFVNCVPTKRVNAIPTEDVLWVMANHSVQARSMVSNNVSSFIY